jgi:hypothetical protein
VNDIFGGGGGEVHPASETDTPTNYSVFEPNRNSINGIGTILEAQSFHHIGKYAYHITTIGDIFDSCQRYF